MADRSSWSHYATVTTNTALISGTSTEIVGYLDLSELDSTFFSNAKADGSDIVIVPSGETTDANKLPRELVGFSTATNVGELFFGPITVTSATSTSWDVWVGNASGAETNSTSVWSDYVAVYHMNNDLSTGNLIDSSPQGNDATPSNFSTDPRVTGEVCGAIDFNGTNQYCSVTMSGTNLTNGYTLMFWANKDSSATTQDVFATQTSSSTLRMIWAMLTNDSIDATIKSATNRTSSSYAGGTFYHGAHSHPGGTSTGNWYVNASLDEAFDQTLVPTSQTTFFISRYSTRYFNGKISELRLSSVEFSEDQVSTEYEQQNAPQTFWTYGSTQSTGGAPTTPEQNSLFFGGGA